MKKIIIVLNLVLFSMQIFCQNTIPAGYTTMTIPVGFNSHSYISLNNNSQKQVSQSGWDIAVYNDFHEIGGKVNDVVGTRVWRVYTDTTNFSSVSLADTLTPIFNNDSFAYLGALDTIYTGNMNVYFKLGLGHYFLSSYNTYGDKVYIIQREDGSFGKFFLNSYDKSNNRSFNFKYSNIDNTNVRYISAQKQLTFTKDYQYINLNNGTNNSLFEDISYNNWDIMMRPLTIHTTSKSFPLAVLTNNTYHLMQFSPVSGIPAGYLTNAITSTEAYPSAGAVSTAVYNNSLDSYLNFTKLNNQIAGNWYDETSLNAKKDLSYFVKTNNGCIFHLIFSQYNSSDNSVVVGFKKIKCVPTSSISSINNSSDNLLISQNESQIELKSLDNNQRIKELKIYDLMGKELLNQSQLNTSKITIEKNQFVSKFIIIQTTIDQQLFINKIVLD